MLNNEPAKDDYLDSESSFSVTSLPTYFIYTIQAANSASLTNVLYTHQISIINWRVLAVLQEVGGINIRFLARRLAMDRSNLSRVIDTMANDGLIKRKILPNDRRNFIITLTDTGRKKVQEVFPDVLVDSMSTMDGFSNEEKETMMRLLSRMHQNATAKVNF
mgnify:CR=1 FL=1